VKKKEKESGINQKGMKKKHNLFLTCGK